MSKKVGPYGVRNGEEFDDGVYDHVCKVTVGEDSHGVVYIKIEYMKNGRIVQREHGRNARTTHIEPHFIVDYPNEYITSIWGSYKNSVSELQFKTSHGRTSQKFGKPGSGSKEFVLEGKNGTKLVGLHGRSGDILDALGAHFVFVSSAIKQLEPQGGSHWVSWDDGAYDSLSKVCVEEDGESLSYIEFEYVKGNQEITELIPHSHGKKQQRVLKTFALYENEYVKSVEGTYNGGFVSSLTFITNSRKSEVFGIPVGTKFVLQAKGFDKLVGFRGRSFADHITALGAHFAVLLAPPVMKLKANGDNFGDEWDDGIHDNVRKITVTHNGQSVNSVQFEYVSGAYSTLIGDVHGKINEDHNKKEFMLEENEFIESVYGLYGQKSPCGMFRHLPGTGCCFVAMLRFNTNLDSYQVLGNQQGKYEVIDFSLAEEGHQIVGFHGKSTSLLQQIGAYVKPIDYT